MDLRRHFSRRAAAFVFVIALAYFTGIIISERGWAEENLPLMSMTKPVISLTASRLIYKRGEKVKFVFTARNTTSSTQALTFPSGQSYDLTITGNGKDIWRWSVGKMFTMAIVHREIPPGESLTYDITWDGKDKNGKPVPDGLYLAKAWLSTAGGSKPAAVTAMGIGKLIPSPIISIRKSAKKLTGKLVFVRAKLFGGALECSQGWLVKDETGGIDVCGPMPFTMGDKDRLAEMICTVKISPPKDEPYLEYLSASLIMNIAGGTTHGIP